MDLYALLGVSRNATADAIERAYRRLARRYHPGVNPGDRDAEEMFRQVRQAYDVLAMDAFSSDSIPVHLITSEATALFFQHLKPDGILAYHISNRFLDLKPVLANIAQANNLSVRLITDSPGDGSTSSITDWVLLARSPAAFDDERLAEVVEEIEPNPHFSLWTDQFNNLIDVLKSNPINELRRLVGLS